MEYREREEEGYLRRDGNKGKGMEEREAEKGGKDRVGYGVNAIRNIHTFSISQWNACGLSRSILMTRPLRARNLRLIVPVRPV